MKPLTPELSILPVVEGTHIRGTCRSNGGRPAPQLSLVLRNSTQNLTSETTTIKDHNTDTFIVSTELRRKVHRSDNGQKLYCSASNSAAIHGIQTEVPVIVYCK